MRLNMYICQRCSHKCSSHKPIDEYVPELGSAQCRLCLCNKCACKECRTMSRAMSNPKLKVFSTCAVCGSKVIRYVLQDRMGGNYSFCSLKCLRKV